MSSQQTKKMPFVICQSLFRTCVILCQGINIGYNYGQLRQLQTHENKVHFLGTETTVDM